MPQVRLKIHAILENGEVTGKTHDEASAVARALVKQVEATLQQNYGSRFTVRVSGELR